ncbi:Uu.00g037120.m01.CDS01 [Anthostomella pinea]|uniref:Uu.00g037120.m01.CDS01 n=1 Tax=Anthostomella pinea TaxID=933095 RepID=A0AAI8V9F5_9PEZI|nr:Uu.00g037120.m01.CDS01 [Anthostomella pinea]
MSLGSQVAPASTTSASSSLCVVLHLATSYDAPTKTSNPLSPLTFGAMAAVIGDFVTDHSRFHNMIAPSALQHEHPHSCEPAYRSEPRNTSWEAVSHKSWSPVSSTQHRAAASSATPSKRLWESSESGAEQKNASTGGASRFPSPPDSSSSNPASARVKAQNATSPPASYMAVEQQPTASAVTTATPIPAQQQPSPKSDTPNTVPSPPSAYNASAPQQGRTVVVRDLAHIQSLARADLMNGSNGPGILNDPPQQAMKYEISGMPIGDIIEMVAALLTKITTTNDLQHDALHRNATHQQTAASHNTDGSSMSPLSSSVLAFHGKNVPAITILSYLSRIHKYCPTTYEVFLSLLVYFDRMTERVNNMVVEAEEARRQTQQDQQPRTAPVDAQSSRNRDMKMRDENGVDSDEAGSDLADDEDGGAGPGKTTAGQPNDAATPQAGPSPATYFVVDSFNIHRLIIAGVTCASKFFSDVFYTNSRYAKVGGLPLAELNHLELQFLLLNDFRLNVPVEDLEVYATMLVEFYAREVLAQRSRPATVPE